MVPGIGKTHNGWMSFDEYKEIFRSCDFKIEDLYLQRVLETFHRDENGKVNYEDIIKEFNNLK